MNAMRELRESVVNTPEEPLESLSRPLRRLKGYKSGMQWVKQRNKMLQEAVPLCGGLFIELFITLYHLLS